MPKTLLSVRDVRGIAEADIELGDRITWIAGDNAQGKSSLADSLRALLSRERTPLTGVVKFDGPAMTRLDAKVGSANLINGAWQASARWTAKSADAIKTGGPDEDGIWASPVAAGQVSFMAMKAAERGTMFWELFKVNPTDDQIKGRLKKAGIAEPYDDILEEIRSQDWELAAKVYGDRARDKKGEWAGITGRPWGAELANGWTAQVPMRGDGQSRANLTEAVDKAKIALTQAQQNRAGLGPDLRESGMKYEFGCPDCGTVHQLMIKDGKLIPYQHVDPNKVAAQRKIAAGLDGALSRAEGDLGRAQRELAGFDAVTDAAIEQASIKTKKAAALHREIEELLSIQQQLLPTGIRAFFRDEQIQWVNECLAEVCTAMGIEPVEILAGAEPGTSALVMTATLGGRAYYSLSRSEKFRVDVVLQLEIAKRDGSSMILIDDADTLMAKQRFGLIKALEFTGLRAVVFAAAQTPDKVVQDPSKWKWGPLYWVSAGTIAPFAQALESRKGQAA